MAYGNAAKLGQLHAAARARWRHYAERPVLRAPSFRHCRGGPGRLSAHPPWPGRQTPDLHARRHQAHAARQSGVFLRVRGQFRDGMARRPAQRRAVHARHGALRDVYRRAAQDPAGRGRPQAECQVAAAGRRRCRRDVAFAAACEGAGRRARGVPDERRDALSGKRLPRADGDTRLGSQYVGEVAAADRSRRRALAPPRGNIEIHRSAREWHRPALHLRDGREVGNHRSEPAGSDEPQIRLHRGVGIGLVGARQDRARGRFARRRPQLAGRQARWSGRGTRR